MKLQFLGTAAAEAFPALFCHCEVCRRARAAGGKDIRARSGLLLNDTAMIDFPPDIYLTMLRFGLDIGNVRDLFITHSHSDHFDVNELHMRDTGAFCHLRPDEPGALNVFGNDGVTQVLRGCADLDFENQTYLNFTEIAYFQPVTAQNGLVFTYLPATHKRDEHAGIYLIEGEGKRVLYAHDTGLFDPRVYDFLRGKPLDVISLDCCFGKLDGGFYGHMGLPQNRQVVARLQEEGCLKPDTRIIVHHFSHNCGQLHAELEQEVAADGFLVAYDGMIVTL